jgi:DNA repair protein RadC
MITSTPTLSRESATRDLFSAVAGFEWPGPLPALEELASLGVLELRDRLGLEELRASSVFAAFELGRRRQIEKLEPRPCFDSPAAVYAFAAPAARDLKFEVFRVFVLDSRNRLVAEDVVSRGILTASLVHPREVFRPALTASGAAIIISHNHPSGDPTPSRDDDGVTERIAKAGDLLGISLLDHLIIGERGYWSYRERGAIASRFDLAVPRPVDRNLSTSESVTGSNAAMAKSDPYAFVVAPPGEVEAAHLVSVDGGVFGLLTRGSVICRAFLPLRDEKAMRAAFRRAGFDGQPTPPPRALAGLARAIEAYFRGKPVDPAEVPASFDPGSITPLAFEVYRALRRVPRGRTISYGELAALAGRPGAARSVGGFMARNRFPLLVPCHRVVAHDGGLGGFSSSGGLGDKKRLLSLEGVLSPALAQDATKRSVEEPGFRTAGR